MNKSANLEYEGCNYMRLRLVLATLSGKSLKIKNIRSKDTSPGLTVYESSLIRLFDKITNGSRIQVRIDHRDEYLERSDELFSGRSIKHLQYGLRLVLLLLGAGLKTDQTRIFGTTNSPTSQRASFSHRWYFLDLYGS